MNFPYKSHLKVSDQNFIIKNGLSSSDSIFKIKGYYPPSPTPTPTPTQTITATSTPTPTPTQTVTATSTPTPTPTQTVTATSTPTPTPTQTVTATSTPTPTPTQTVTATSTPTPTPTQTVTATSTPTPTPTQTPTPSTLTVPSEPLNLTAIPEDSKVELSWNSPSSNGGRPVTDYVVQYSLNQINWVTYSDNISNVTSVIVDNLINGTAYFFRVAAINEIGQGVYSDVIGPFVPNLILKITSETGLNGFTNNSPEYVEIKNLSPYEGKIDGWYIISHDTPPDCSVGNPPEKYTIPNGNYIIQPNQTFRIYSGTNASTLNSPPTAFFWDSSFKWNDNGDIADLYDRNDRWIDTIATLDCLDTINAYNIAFSNGTGSILSEIQVNPDTQTYLNIDILPSPLTKNSGLRNSTSTATGWRMLMGTNTSSPIATTLSEGISQNKTLDFNIQNLNQGLVKRVVNSFSSLRVTRNTNGPKRMALVCNKTNVWSSYTTLFDTQLNSVSPSVNDLTSIIYQGLFNNEEQVTINPNETLYFRFVLYDETDTNGELWFVGGASSAQLIKIRASIGNNN
jgi:hypothetical protein